MHCHLPLNGGQGTQRAAPYFTLSSSVHLGGQICSETESETLNFHIHLPGYWWMIIRKIIMRKKARLQWMKMLFPSRYQWGVVHTALLHPSCCLEVSDLFNNARNPVFSTQGVLLTTSERYCWEGPSQNVPFFPVWNWLHHDLCTCFHAILNVWVVSSLCRAAREGSWQALEWLTSGWVSSREWVCYFERGQDFLAAESKEAVSQGKLQDACEAKVSVNRIILWFFKHF